MKRERLFVENRRNKIFNIINFACEISVIDLANQLEVSEITIRRDLQALEDENKIARFYGGARKIVNEEGEKICEVDEVKMYRRLIAEFAATLIEDEDSLFINTSRTALDVVKYIKKDNVKVITNNGHAITIEKAKGVSIILTGGELRTPKYAMVGEFAERNLRTVFAKKTFIGCSGISPQCGVTTENANEVNSNKLMLDNALGETYILADHTKIGKHSSFKTCGLEKVKNLITDEKAPEEIITMFKEKGINIYQVKKV